VLTGTGRVGAPPATVPSPPVLVPKPVDPQVGLQEFYALQPGKFVDAFSGQERRAPRQSLVRLTERQAANALRLRGVEPYVGNEKQKQRPATQQVPPEHFCQDWDRGLPAPEYKATRPSNVEPIRHSSTEEPLSDATSRPLSDAEVASAFEAHPNPRYATGRRAVEPSSRREG
jgi:hypothetical protein